MKARWIHNNQIDVAKWDELVNADDDATIFSTSHYLNATCKDWYAFLPDDYSFGFALGSTNILGVDNANPPFFHRYAEFIGESEQIDISQFVTSMQETFKGGIIHTKTKLEGIEPADAYVHQVLTADDFKLKSQAKRMLKKFNSSTLNIEFDNKSSSQVLKLIKDELSKKMDLYSSESANALDRLVTNPSKEIELITAVLKSENDLVGGLLALEYKSTVLFLKGTTAESAKEEGGMYALMNELIKYTFEKEKTFDFGGSRVKGVRFFNTRFNAQDKTYFCYEWNNNPVWYKLLKKMNRWRKK
tara:strand:- start:39948 stop:40853 length:906 start_codon:yes stop_codon:yes gene_type:complete